MLAAKHRLGLVFFLPLIGPSVPLIEREEALYTQDQILKKELWI